MGKDDHELDQELENGPIENRSCQDLLFCLLFIAAVIAMFVIGIYGYANGDPSRLAIPYDSDGNYLVIISIFFYISNIFFKKKLNFCR